MKFVKQFLNDIKQISERFDQYQTNEKNKQVFQFIFTKKKHSKQKIKEYLQDIVQQLCMLENSQEKKVQNLKKQKSQQNEGEDKISGISFRSTDDQRLDTLNMSLHESIEKREQIREVMLKFMEISTKDFQDAFQEQQGICSKRTVSFYRETQDFSFSADLRPSYVTPQQENPFQINFFFVFIAVSLIAMFVFLYITRLHEDKGQIILKCVKFFIKQNFKKCYFLEVIKFDLLYNHFDIYFQKLTYNLPMENCESIIEKQIDQHIEKTQWQKIGYFELIKISFYFNLANLKAMNFKEIFTRKNFIFLSFILFLFFILFFFVAYYCYNDYIYELVQHQKGRKLKQTQNLLSFVQYLGFTDQHKVIVTKSIKKLI